MLFPQLTSSWAVVALTCASSVRALAFPKSSMKQPSLDPFYKVPSNISAYKVGEIIRERPVDTIAAGAKSAYQILYRTNTALDNADATVATVWAPSKLAPGPPKIVSFQAPEDSAAFDCAPSFSVIKDSPSNSSGDTLGFYIDASLFNGWYVVQPDFEGSLSAYIVGKSQAYGVLDGIRAILKHKPTIPDATGAQTVLAGYSGGGHASAYAGQYKRAYAPELNIIGSASGGTPVDLKLILTNLNKTPFAGYAIAALAAFVKTFPDVNQYLRSILNDQGKQAIEFLQSYACVPQELLRFAFVDYYTYLTVPYEQALAEPIVVKALEENFLGKGPGAVVTDFPRYLYHGILDEVIPQAPVAQYVKDQCAAGSKVRYHTDLIAGHVLEGIEGFLPSFQFIKDTFDGKTKNMECSEEHNIVSFLPNLYNDYATKLVGKAALNKVRALNGKTIAGESIHF
ncbi:LIP-domain-containing protein [Ceraceosorus guamensis]|uniref:triacylglycerol lipase n=1 Tax=Ceraceosorus guamensis TaxID=1522189 RepID=A0A316W4B5_9BASI|nr:LIP-domain-containing protein [Ceraceosorus guamensis]PWN42465.1 LIP-domain-containing protein [Ceraceosorus guamensis]